MSLLKNCTSVIPSVVNLSLQIFVRLIGGFKDHLKAEIEVPVLQGLSSRPKKIIFTHAIRFLLWAAPSAARAQVFICNVFLRLLESENSTVEHKSLVLEVFHAICQDPQVARTPEQ